MPAAANRKRLLNEDTEFRNRVFDELVELADGEPYRGRELCEYLSDFTGEPGVNYDGKLFQRWYVWRYYIAYIYEYAHMYLDVLKDLEDEAPSSLNILSVGCGMGVDYRGLRYARQELAWPVKARLGVDYMGVDLAPWDESLLVSGYKFDQFEIRTSTDIVEYLGSAPAVTRLHSLDAVVFPKSLGDLPDEAIVCIARALVQNGPQTLYLCNVPPCGKHPSAGGDNRDSWTNRPDVERKLALLFDELRSAYDVPDTPAPLFEGIQHDVDDWTQRGEEVGTQYLPWAFKGSFGRGAYFGDFQEVFPAQQAEAVHALCQHECSGSCPCWEDGAAQPKLLRSPIVWTGRLSYEVYKFRRGVSIGARTV